MTYIINFADELISMDWNESELENDDLKNYKMKAEFYIRQNQDNAVIAKLKTNQPLTSADVKVLEGILWSEVGTKQDYENEYGSKPLGEFVREIVGLDMNAAKEAFAQYLNDASLDSNQIYFVNQLALHHTLRNIGNGGNTADFLIEVSSCLGILFAHEKGKFDAIH